MDNAEWKPTHDMQDVQEGAILKKKKGVAGPRSSVGQKRTQKPIREDFG